MRDNKLSPAAAATVLSTATAGTASVSSTRATATLSPSPDASAASASASASSRNAVPRCTASNSRTPDSQLENATRSTPGLRHRTASHKPATAQHSLQLERKFFASFFQKEALKLCSFLKKRTKKLLPGGPSCGAGYRQPASRSAAAAMSASGPQYEKRTKRCPRARSKSTPGLAATPA